MPDLPKAAHPIAKGKLVVEQFRDYRFIEPSPDKFIERENLNDVLFQLFLFPWSGVTYRNPGIGVTYEDKDSKAGTAAYLSLARVVAEDFKKRGWFDEVVYAPSAEKVPDANWRFVGMIVKADETLQFHGYYLPLITNYLYMAGLPYVRLIYDVTLELKFEDIKNKKTVLQERVNRYWISKNYNEYQFSGGYRGWNVGYYELSKAFRAIMNDYTQKLQKELENYGKI